MTYSDETIKNIHDAYTEAENVYQKLQTNLLIIGRNFKSTKAQEYMAHGVCRRLRLITQSFENIFTLFPPTQKNLLDRDTLTNIEINLHAFLINIIGVMDNLAWCCAYEHKATTNVMLKKHDVGLFKKKLQRILGDRLKQLIQSDRINNWHEKYAKNFRDALAHRIPVYIPPSVVDEKQAKEYEDLNNEINSLDMRTDEGLKRWNEILSFQSKMGRVAFYFSHSLDEGGRPVWIHPQLLCDIKRIEEILGAFVGDSSGYL